MTDESSPYDLYDPSSLGWLHRRKEKKMDILNEDLARILDANADLVADPLLRGLLVEGLRGRLYAKRGPKRTISRELRELHVVELYVDLLPYLQARADRRKQNGYRKTQVDFAPAELACELIGRRVGMAGESVRNLISRKKNT
jgi:hypothetical protein